MPPTDSAPDDFRAESIAIGEGHRSHRTSWLRAAVLGANDGIVSIASLVVGVAAANPAHGVLLTAGLAGLVGGALSMAVGEYVSVHSQRDAELADIRLEKYHLAADPDYELDELAQIYVARGLSTDLAHEVARQLTARGALAAHTRDELGISPRSIARPWQAAFTSGIAFSLGALCPLVSVLVAPAAVRIPVTIAVALVALAILGVIGARLGGAPVGRALMRTLVGSGLAMGLTFLIGHWFGVAT